MVYWRVAEFLEKRGWTAYELAKQADMTVSLAYRVARRDEPVQRIDAETLETLCRVFGVTPGDLLTLDPPKRRKG